MNDTEKSARIISRLGDLPAMPDVVSNVLTITDNPNRGMDDVSRAIEADPSMTAKVLRVSNSSYYGMKDYENALTELLAANKIYDSDPRVLNLLGFTLFNLAEYQEALKTFNASLQLDNDQAVIHRVVKEINNRLKKK